MISAKFKCEDERTSVIRLVSFQWAVLLFMFAQLINQGVCFYHQSGSYRPRYALNLMLLVSLIVLCSQVYFLPFIKIKYSKMKNNIKVERAHENWTQDDLAKQGTVSRQTFFH